MGISKFSEAETIKRAEAPKEPVYRKEIGTIQCSVWEDRVGGEYRLTAKFSRYYYDKSMRKCFVESFGVGEMEDLEKLVSIVRKDMEAAMAEERDQQANQTHGAY